MFEIVLGNFTEPPNTVSKVFRNQKTYNCQSNDVIDVDNPTITIQSNEILTDYNYCYIPIFETYYFVNSPVVSANGIWSLKLHVDVLKTYEDELKTMKAALQRSETFYNQYLPDNRAPLTPRQIVTNHIFPKSAFDNKIAEHGVVVMITGAD